MIIILMPMKPSTSARPYGSRWKRSAMPASRKNIARRPSTANTLEVSTMNGSVVIAKIAGMLSTAKITSVTAIRISTANSGVNQRTPSRFTLSALPA
ncbi:hypothetical protein G6F31_021422 [Rhizopus arrhizus]|nr:hypothetical protein G6F31_021422 [Rhizopus arrhizus]